MKINWIAVKNCLIGVVYRYFTSDNRSYVGCTIHEVQRRAAWKNTNYAYGGKKIEAARQKYGIGAFSYEVLCKVLLSKNNISLLEKFERKYIREFDSFNNGFNSNWSGRGRAKNEKCAKKV